MAKFSQDFLSHEDSGTLSNFLLMSEDFYNVTTTCLIDDFRKIKLEKADNFIYLMSYIIKVMHDIATQYKIITDENHKKTLRGCINLMIRTFPILFEDKDLMMRCMWREQALFSN